MLFVIAPLLSLSLAAPDACAADALERASTALVRDAAGRTQVVLGDDLRFTLGAVKASDVGATPWGPGFVQWTPAARTPRVELGPVPFLGAPVFAVQPDGSAGAGVVARRARSAGEAGGTEIEFVTPLLGVAVVFDACGRWVGVAKPRRGRRAGLESAEALVNALLHPETGFRVASEVRFGVNGAGEVVVHDASPESPLKTGDRVVDMALLPARDAMAAARALRAQPADKKMLIKVRRGDADAVVFLAPRE